MFISVYHNDINKTSSSTVASQSKMADLDLVDFMREFPDVVRPRRKRVVTKPYMSRKNMTEEQKKQRLRIQALEYRARFIEGQNKDMNTQLDEIIELRDRVRKLDAEHKLLIPMNRTMDVDTVIDKVLVLSGMQNDLRSRIQRFMDTYRSNGISQGKKQMVFERLKQLKIADKSSR